MIQGEKNAITLKHLSDTRWQSRQRSFEAIIFSYQHLLTFLRIVDENTNNLSGAIASGLLSKLQEYKFLFIIYLLKKLFDTTDILSKYLQLIDITIMHAQDLAASTIVQLSSYKELSTYEKFIEDVNELASKCEIELPNSICFTDLTKRSNRSTRAKQANVEFDYKKCYDETVDVFIQDIQSRFEQRNISPILSIYNLINAKTSVINEVLNEIKIYSDLINLDKLIKELEIWYSFKTRKNLSDFDLIITEFRENNLKSVFPEIFMLVKIYLTIPISSAGCERSFSCIKRIKTYLRSTMGQSRVSSLAILNLESELIPKIDIEKVIDEFGNQKNRRIKFFE